MPARARRVRPRDFSKRIFIDSLIADFAQLAHGSCSSSVVHVFEYNSCFSS